MHEMLHTIGFHHMQSASNRDNYIDILWENIKEENKHNFNNYNSTVITDFGQEYDYKSIMHYSNEAFTKQKGLKTMVAKVNLQYNIFFIQINDFIFLKC